MGIEIWKQLDITVYGPKYSVSNKGRLRIKTIKGYKYRTGSYSNNSNTQYIKVSLSFNGKNFTKFMHRLVAEAFIPNPDNKPFVNHIDFDGSNNNVGNLEWVTQSENIQHSADNIKPKDKKLSVMKRTETVRKDKFIENLYFIGTDMGGRVLEAVIYDPRFSSPWRGLFSCANCKKDFQAPLNQSFDRFHNGKRQYCRKCYTITRKKKI